MERRWVQFIWIMVFCIQWKQVACNMTIYPVLRIWFGFKGTEIPFFDCFLSRRWPNRIGMTRLGNGGYWTYFLFSKNGIPIESNVQWQSQNEINQSTREVFVVRARRERETKAIAMRMIYGRDQTIYRFSMNNAHVSQNDTWAGGCVNLYLEFFHSAKEWTLRQIDSNRKWLDSGAIATPCLLTLSSIFRRRGAV